MPFKELWLRPTKLFAQQNCFLRDFKIDDWYLQNQLSSISGEIDDNYPDDNLSTHRNRILWRPESVKSE